MNRKIRNPNTPKLWDKLLFQRNAELLRSPIYQDKLRKILSFLKTKKGRLLDIGFGMANLERWIINNHLPIDIYGADISARAVSRASKILKGKFLVSSAEKLPFRNSFFDLIVIADVLEHIEKDKSSKVLGEIRRVLKVGGYLIISVPLNEGLDETHKHGSNENRHMREYTSEVLMKELKDSRFVSEKNELLYAFRNHYLIKSLIVRIIPGLRKPNLLITYARKK